MITIYCALYQEAQSFIERYQLKKENGQRNFPVFINEDAGVRLVISGVGMAAAVAVAEISTVYPPGKEDFLFNFGTCAGGEAFPVGQIYLCNKLTEKASGRTFYPDILYQHPFPETELVSVSKVVGNVEKEDGLFDMEAAFFYQAGSYYYNPDRMIFVKVVSDHGIQRNEMDREGLQIRMRELMEQTREPLFSYLETLRKISGLQEKTGEMQRRIRQEAQKEAARLGKLLYASVTMRMELEQLLYYWKLTGTGYQTLIEEYSGMGMLPVKDKREGKKILEQLKAKLL